jgi:hypothetical protein
MQEPAMAFLQASCAVGLRHERVESEQQAHHEDHDRHEERAADPDRANRFRTEPTDHQRIDDAHGHPSELRQNDWNGEVDHRPEFLFEVAQGRKHEDARRT